MNDRYSGLEFRNEKGKASLVLNITMFFRESLHQGQYAEHKASLNPSLCTEGTFWN